MLNNLRRSAQLYTVEHKTDKFKEDIRITKPLKEISVSIVLSNFSQYNQNNLKLKNCTYIGITDDSEAREGMKLDSYTIKYVLPLGAEYVLYLEEI